MWTGTLRQHLCKFHLDEWVDECDKHGYKITAKEAQAAVDTYRRRKGQTRAQASTNPGPRKKYSNEAFVDALAEFIIADDQVPKFLVYPRLKYIYTNNIQSINVVESPHLRGIFLMLQEELQNSDIPSRTTIRAHIHELLDGHLDQLEEEMQVCFLFHV
jgi:hypothetical protein